MIAASPASCIAVHAELMFAGLFDSVRSDRPIEAVE